MKKYLFLIAALFISLSMFGQRASLNVRFVRIGNYLILDQSDKDSILSPDQGSIVSDADSSLYFYNGAEWINLTSKQDLVQFRSATFNGEPSQCDFSLAFGVQTYFYQFTFLNLNGNKVYQGSYIPGYGFYFEKLKQ